MSEWICYLLHSTNSNKTYVGATNNLYNRLNKHHSKTGGAKYTKGEFWYVVLVVTGFTGKKSCLSFESGWHKIRKRQKKFIFKIKSRGLTNRLIQLANLTHLGNLKNKWHSSRLTIHLLEKINIPEFLSFPTNINNKLIDMPFMNI